MNTPTHVHVQVSTLKLNQPSAMHVRIYGTAGVIQRIW